jgi:hypothetical protein
MLLAPDRDHRVTEVRHMGDGRYLAALMDLSASRDAEGRYVAPEPLRFLDEAGNVLDSLRHGGGRDMLLFSETSANGMMMVLIAPPPFGRGTSYTVGRQHLFTGWNGEYRIVAWSRTGQPSVIISASDLMRPVDPADADAFRQRRLDDCANEQCERAARAMFDDVVLPETEPAFSALMVDALEHLWVAEYELEADSVSGWHVFSPDGELLGRVAIPSRLAIHEIGADYVLGAQRDALDVPFVKRFPLSRLE